ncbi:hypothetical protein GALMADRAFT_245090 [Galerina marginata CBS 339.88]|uniref:Uncharacterized protein n=1 Tax=Galerina marginata (strain CBS 339.88) TaxID=685588 RepID=A0A067TGI4_GALM3|nr:hypothetical protein GALMADRAFT_245090 [Galerina marginata CBS 339.88]
MPTVTTTAVQQEPPLRKRLRLLERTHSLTNLNTAGTSDGKISDLKMRDGDKGGDPPESPTDFESHSDSSDEHSYEEENHDKQQRPTVDTTNLHKPRSHKEHSPMSPNTRAWYEFDLAVVVALVSPIGNWLTGGDHVKNLLLIVLLIFYLHQIIEIPWTLYQKARPHKRAGHLPPSGALDDPMSEDARYAQLAASELQKLEFFFLFLTFLSPLLGAALLRYATEAILGPDAVSWFSTALFVLATGMRPWSHLVERLNQRTYELQDFVHYPSATRSINEEQHKLLERRVAQLEKALGKVQDKVVHATEDVYEYVDDAVDAVEHAMRKQEKKWDRYEGKVKEVEQVVGRLSSNSSRQSNYEYSLRRAISGDLGILHTFFTYIIKRIIPAWLLTPPTRNHYSTGNGSASLNTPSPSMFLGVQTIGTAPSGSKISMRPISGSSSPSPCSTPLETIMEEDVPDRRNSGMATSPLARPYSITSNLVYRVGYLATAPLRAVVRMVLRNY